MTAEVVVANKLGVALAADSAATISTENGAKTYNTANKLFTVSKFHPVGVMIYGSSELNTIPWEILIKGFRHSLKRNSFPTIAQYAEEFLNYLERNSIIKDKEKEMNLISLSGSFFSMINGQVEKEIQNQAKGGSPKDTSSIIDDVLKLQGDKIKRSGICPSLQDTSKSDFDRYDGILTKVQEHVFSGLLLSNPQKKRLLSLFKEVFLSNMFSPFSSGIVFAGYGDDEYYPQVIALDTDGFVADKCKMRISSELSITADCPAGVSSFAQSDVWSLFVHGVDPEYQKEIMDAVLKVLKAIPDIAKDHFGVSGSVEGDKKAATLKKALLDIYSQFKDDLDKYRSERLSGPLIEAVRYLDKEDAANFAESLVSLTALKRRVSLHLETVGGPIDVAFISKNDGFVWIRRKHYFQQELNPFFLQRYLQDTQEAI